MEKAYYKLLNDILLGYDRTTPAKISHLRSNQIFVFGTDKYGSQKYGAARLNRKSNAETNIHGWEDILGEKKDEYIFAGPAPTNTHSINPVKSELNGGQQQTFVAPYTRCDRIADYRTAWAHFEKVFNKE